MFFEYWLLLGKYLWALQGTINHIIMARFLVIFIFPKLKSILKGRNYQLIEEINKNAEADLLEHPHCVYRDIPDFEKALPVIYSFCGGLL